MISIHNDLLKIIGMFWEMEKRHWQESNYPDDHIFISLDNVKKWMEKQQDDPDEQGIVSL